MNYLEATACQFARYTRALHLAAHSVYQQLISVALHIHASFLSNEHSLMRLSWESPSKFVFFPNPIFQLCNRRI